MRIHSGIAIMVTLFSVLNGVFSMRPVAGNERKRYCDRRKNRRLAFKVDWCAVCEKLITNGMWIQKRLENKSVHETFGDLTCGSSCREQMVNDYRNPWARWFNRMKHSPHQLNKRLTRANGRKRKELEARIAKYSRIACQICRKWRPKIFFERKGNQCDDCYTKMIAMRGKLFKVDLCASCGNEINDYKWIQRCQRDQHRKIYRPFGDLTCQPSCREKMLNPYRKKGPPRFLEYNLHREFGRKMREIYERRIAKRSKTACKICHKWRPKSKCDQATNECNDCHQCNECDSSFGSS